MGGKTATKWINQYGSLDHILEGKDLDPKVRDKVEASRELIIQNRQMVALDLDLPLPLPIEGMKLCPRYPELIEALRNCEFRSLVAEAEREAEGSEARRSDMGVREGQSAVTNAKQQPDTQMAGSDSLNDPHLPSSISNLSSPIPDSPSPIPDHLFPSPPAQAELF